MKISKGIIIGFLIFFPVLVKSANAIVYIKNCTNLNISGETYILQTPITNSDYQVCMNISNNSIVLDCKGCTIGGNRTSNTFGIYIYRSSDQNTNITIKNCRVSDWGYGIYLISSSNNTIINSTFYLNSYGIFLSSSHNNKIINSTSNSNYYHGIYLSSSSNNQIINSNFNSNSYHGIFLYRSSNFNQIINSNFNSNSQYGIYLSSSSNNQIINSSSNSNSYYGILLSSSHNNKIINSTFYLNSYGIYSSRSNYNQIINSSSNSNQRGIYLYYSNDNQIINSNFNSNSQYGIYLDSSFYNQIINSSSNSNSYYGIFLSSSNDNQIINSNFNSNSYGVCFSSSNNNTIHSNRIENSSQYGIYLSSSGFNLIYNNLFNNTNNFNFSGTIYSNYWNTTKQLGQRIYSPGNYIGGNYWTNPSKSGYSDTCSDINPDGFCKNPLILDPGQTGNNTDYLPLSYLGVLEIYATTPPPQITRGKTFQMNVSVKCREKECKNVYVGLRYNSTTSSPNFPVPVGEGTPFYITQTKGKPYNYTASGFLYRVENASDDDTSSSAQLVTFGTLSAEVNFTFYIPSTKALLFTKVKGDNLDGIYPIGSVRIYNFSSNSWYVWIGDVDNSTIEKLEEFTISSGLLSKNRTLLLNFYITSRWSIMDIYEIFVLYYPGFCYNLTIGESCNLTFNVNATGSYYSAYLLDANTSSSTAHSNDTTNFLVQIVPGSMSVSLTYPDPAKIHNASRYFPFTIKGNVRCIEGECGNVLGVLKYNKTSAFPDKDVPLTSGEPFYIISNSSYCPSLKEGSFCVMNWTINVTGRKYTDWKIGIIFTSDVIRGSFATENLTVTIFPQYCSVLPYINDGKLRVTTECDGKYYSFARSREEFNLLYPWKAEVSLHQISSTLKNFMVGFGNGNLDNYGRPLNSYVFEFNDTHIRFLKYNSSLIEELGSRSIFSPFSSYLSIEFNSSNITFIVGSEKFEFPFSSSINSWYFFANAYSSKDTIVDLDNIIIRKKVLPEPTVYVDFANEEYLAVKRVGLASEQGRQNLVSVEKISKLNQICSQGGYEDLKTIFGLDAEFYLIIKRMDGNILLACGSPSRGEPFALIERIIALDDGSYAKLEMRVWR